MINARSRRSPACDGKNGMKLYHPSLNYPPPKFSTCAILVACICTSAIGGCGVDPAPSTPPAKSFHFLDIDLSAVVDLLADEAGIVVDSEVIKRGTVNLKWEGVSAREALDMVFKMNSLSLLETNGEYKIVSTIEGENPALMEPSPRPASPSPNALIEDIMQEYHEQVMQEWQAKGVTIKLRGLPSATPEANPGH